MSNHRPMPLLGIEGERLIPDADWAMYLLVQPLPRIAVRSWERGMIVYGPNRRPVGGYVDPMTAKAICLELMKTHPPEKNT